MELQTVFMILLTIALVFVEVLRRYQLFSLQQDTSHELIHAKRKSYNDGYLARAKEGFKVLIDVESDTLHGALHLTEQKAKELSSLVVQDYLDVLDSNQSSSKVMSNVLNWTLSPNERLYCLLYCINVERVLSFSTTSLLKEKAHLLKSASDHNPSLFFRLLRDQARLMGRASEPFTSDDIPSPTEEKPTEQKEPIVEDDDSSLSQL